MDLVILEVRSIASTKFNSLKLLYKIKITGQIEKAFNQLIANSLFEFKKRLPNLDSAKSKIGTKLIFSDDSFTHIEFLKFDKLTGEFIISRLERLIQSNSRLIEAKDHMRIEFTLISFNGI